MTRERRNQIIDLIMQNRTVKNTDLMERFGISIETVRRDLECLEREGYLQRVYGGAVLKNAHEGEPEYAKRVEEHFVEKNAIAAAAVQLITPDDFIFLGVGTTVQAMAQYMKECKGVTAFTNSLRTASALSDQCSVVLTGGQLRPKELSLSGFPAEENLLHFNINRAFIGIGGITEKGITDFHIGEARLHQHIIQNASQTVVLADSSKFGVRGMTNVCPFQDVDVLVTDSKAPAEYVELLERSGIQVIIAKS